MWLGILTKGRDDAEVPHRLCLRFFLGPVDRSGTSGGNLP